MKTKTKKTEGARRRLYMGGYGVLLVIAAVAAVVIINMIVRAVPFGYVAFDLSGDDIYNVSEQSRQILDELGEDITVYLVASDETKDERISNFLEKYAGLSDHITLKLVDPDADPAFLTEHEISGEGGMNSVVVESAKRSKTIMYNDIYEYSQEVQNAYQSGYYYFMGYSISDLYDYDVFDADNELTSAIDYVTTDKLSPVYFTTGHGESQSSPEMEASIELNNLSVSQLNLLAGGVPDDAAVVIINAPSSDIGQDELAMLTSYIDGGGKVVLVTDPSKYSAASMPNTASLARYCGLLSVDGIVLEGDDGRHNQGRADIIHAQLCDCIITEGIDNASNYMAVIGRAHGIIKDDEYEGSMISNPILTTSDQAYVIGIDEELRDPDEDDAVGAFWIGAVSHEPDTDATFVWYSSSDVNPTDLGDLPTSSTSALVLFLQTPLAVCDKPVTVTIEKTAMSTNARLTFSERDATVVTVIIQYLIPILILVPGIVVWVRRRLR